MCKNHYITRGQLAFHHEPRAAGVFVPGLARANVSEPEVSQFVRASTVMQPASQECLVGSPPAPRQLAFSPLASNASLQSVEDVRMASPVQPNLLHTQVTQASLASTQAYPVPPQRVEPAPSGKPAEPPASKALEPPTPKAVPPMMDLSSPAPTLMDPATPQQQYQMFPDNQLGDSQLYPADPPPTPSETPAPASAPAAPSPTAPTPAEPTPAEPTPAATPTTTPAATPAATPAQHQRNPHQQQHQQNPHHKPNKQHLLHPLLKRHHHHPSHHHLHKSILVLAAAVTTLLVRAATQTSQVFIQLLLRNPLVTRVVVILMRDCLALCILMAVTGRY